MGVLDRLMVSDAQWERIACQVASLARPGRIGPIFLTALTALGAVLWIVRTAAPWRDLPEGAAEQRMRDS